MTGMDAVEKQVEAFNARDLDAFVACYTREAVIEDADGGVQMSGREEIRKSYGEIFESRPNLPGGGPVANPGRLVRCGRGKGQWLDQRRLSRDRDLHARPRGLHPSGPRSSLTRQPCGWVR
jgi:hypothetical protein